jgi:hypothetical protein
MKIVISLLIAFLVGWGIYKTYQYYNDVSERNMLEEKAATGADINPDTLPGLPPQLEYKAKDAKAAGPIAFKNFLDLCKQYPDVKDPKLAWMQLDYAVMISLTDPVEAKKIYFDVKKRTPDGSPILPRLKQLAKTYE